MILNTLRQSLQQQPSTNTKRGKLHLVDLAGSESLVGEKEALHISHETRAINSALTALCDGGDARPRRSCKECSAASAPGWLRPLRHCA